MSFVRHPQSPLLDHCPEALPAGAYYDASWYAQEQKTLWLNNWVSVGRVNDLPVDRKSTRLNSSH